MKHISLSILESIPTPQTAEGSLVRPLAHRTFADVNRKNDQNPVQSPKAKSVSRKRLDRDELQAPTSDKERSPTDRITFGDFLLAPQPRGDILPEPAITTDKANFEFAPPQSVVVTQSKRPVLQDVIATVQAKPEQSISPVHLQGLPDSFVMEIEPQAEILPTLPTTTEVLSMEYRLSPVDSNGPQFLKAPTLIESADPTAIPSLPTPHSSSSLPVAKISLTSNPIKIAQLAAVLEVDQELPTEISKPVLDNITIDLGLSEVVAPISQQNLKPVSPVVFDDPTKLTAFTYRPEPMQPKTVEPDFTVTPRDVEAPSARISSILKKLIQEHLTEPLLPAVNNEMPTVEPSAPTNMPITIDMKSPQGAYRFDSEPIRLNPSIDSMLASQVVAQISDQWSMEDVKIAQNSTSEITIQIKPQELGAIKILVETTDGQLQARIEASEMITSEMLIREKGHLLNALKDRGLDLPDLDISYRDPESQNSHRQDQQEPSQRFDFRNERQSYKNQAQFDSQEAATVTPPPSKRFVINVIA
jgi:Flagellar hook-length control protein FliK